MDTVSIKDLKAKTSEIVRRTVDGEAFIVTVRGEPTAALVPLPKEEMIDFALERSRAIALDLVAADEALSTGKARPATDVFRELRAKKRKQARRRT